MNNEVIKAKLKLVHEELIQNCYTDKMKELIRTKTYFAGGCVRDLYRDLTPNDYDIYFYCHEDKLDFIDEVKTNFSFKATAIQNYNIRVGDKKIQLITLLTGMPDTVVNQFDYTINQGYFCPQTGTLNLGWIYSQLIVCDKVLAPLNALVRLDKFLKAGYTMSQDTLVQLGVALSKMEAIDTPDKLDEALKGISTSFAINPINHVGGLYDSDSIPF